MHIYRKIYEFAASAGALEGYVYRKRNLDVNSLKNWADNLVTAYRSLPGEVIDKIQPGLDMTVGRAIRSLDLESHGGHEVLDKLKSMVEGELPASPNDFRKKKWFEDGS